MTSTAESFAQRRLSASAHPGSSGSLRTVSWFFKLAAAQVWKHVGGKVATKSSLQTCRCPSTHEPARTQVTPRCAYLQTASGTGIQMVGGVYLGASLPTTPAWSWRDPCGRGPLLTPWDPSGMSTALRPQVLRGQEGQQGRQQKFRQQPFLEHPPRPGSGLHAEDEEDDVSPACRNQ